MREILFRGKRTDNGNWHEGEDVMRNTIRGKVCLAKIGEDWISVEPETVCQFTGLYDRNGRRIFEGDIILYRQIPCVVKYNAKTVHYSLYICGKIEISGFNHDTMKLANIIGNIYDNPELLKGGNDNG